MKLAELDITIPGLQAHYRSGGLTPRKLVGLIAEACDAAPGNPVWIRRLNEKELEPYLQTLEKADPEQLPLYGIPFAIKDNIDLANIPTTAACPGFCYTPQKSARVVELLIEAGAIPIGKTNLDQFATGLNGTRSPEPWGPCKNALNPDYISGGSSSGSAVAVAKGWVSFSLGTDTAGSGRVPAAFNNIVGLKPSRGLLSNQGVVPACRSLDCVSIFTLTADDANLVFDCTAQYDPEDAYSISNSYRNGRRYFKSAKQNSRFHFAVPLPAQLEFFGDKTSQAAFAESIALLREAGGVIHEMDFSCFFSAAKLLYEGPWVAERFVAMESLAEAKPDSLLPVIRDIVLPSKSATATDAFKVFYQLQSHIQASRTLMAKVDWLVTPTAPTVYTVDALLKDPIKLNTNLGYYTNFMNLMDLSAVSVPATKLPSGVGFGITLFAKAQQDKALLAASAILQRSNNLPLGALKLGYRADFHSHAQVPSRAPYATVEVLVCGAHLEGLPLNWQLQERSGSLVRKTKTADCYKMYALPGGPPFRPGLKRDPEGAAIEVEIWRLPVENFGSFVAEIPAPLGIGQVELADGSWVSGFICESYGLDNAEDITAFGGWRAFMRQKNQ